MGTSYLVLLVGLMGLCFGQSVSDVGFCGKDASYVFYNESGKFGCDGYNSSILVEWTIVLPPGQNVLLTFTKFSTEAFYDFVRIYDGPTTSSELMGTFSGVTIPGPFTSTNNSITVILEADPYVESLGITAVWEAIGNVGYQISSCQTNESFEISNSTGVLGCDQYNSNVEVGWRVTGGEGEVLVITFDFMNTELGFDILTIYNGQDSTGKSLGSFSGTFLPPPITAEGNEIYVHFYSDNGIEGAGFQLSWEPLVSVLTPCRISSSSLLSDSQGYIGCPYGYSDNLVSSWLIQLEGDVQIALIFFSLNLEEGADYVSVFDGDSENGIILGTFTGSVTPTDILYTSSNSMFIQLTSDGQVNSNGFTAGYESAHSLQPVGCSKDGYSLLTTPSDQIGCDGYSNGVEQKWYINVLYPEVISLEWLIFDTEEGADFITVYDGNSTDSTILLQASGSDIPNPIISTGQNLLVHFQADEDGVQGTGFSAIYTSTEAVNVTTYCGENNDNTLSGQDGQIGCIGYDNNVVVTWLIHVDEGFSVTLIFEKFFLERNSDYIYVYDGPGDVYPLLGKFSGLIRPPPIVSSSNYLFVSFVSDSSQTRPGFVARYESVYSGNENRCTSNTESPITLTQSNGTFGCDGYDPSLDLNWIIEAPSNYVIDFGFISFYTEDFSDTLTVYDGSSQSDSVIVQHSGDSVPDGIFRSTSNQILVVFHSDSNVQFDGFEIGYTFYLPSDELSMCSYDTVRNLVGAAGQLGCSGYNNSITTSWNITTDPGTVVLLNLVMLDTEYGYDYIEIFDADNNEEMPMAVWTGEIDNVDSTEYSSSFNHMYITFYSDSSQNQFEGFQANYVQVYPSVSGLSGCSENATYSIYDPVGTFGCEGYSEDVNISWHISSFGEIYLNFDHFSTEAFYDILYIYDGPDSNSNLIASYSGNGHKSPLVSTGTDLYLNFITDSTANGLGFSVSYQSMAYYWKD